MFKKHLGLHIIEKINASAPEDRNRILKWLFAMIPDKIENKTVIRILERLRSVQRRHSGDYSAHFMLNQQRLQKHLQEIHKRHGFIEDQNRYTDLMYGDVSMQFSGCEVFAVYNAMKDLHKGTADLLPNMIDSFEKDGMLMHGGLGTSPLALRDYLDRHGCQTVFTTKESMFDSIGRKCSGLILTLYNDRNDISKAIHTIYISKEHEEYIAHNVYCNGAIVGPYYSVSELLRSINNGKAKGISLIGIRING